MAIGADDEAFLYLALNVLYWFSVSHHLANRVALDARVFVVKVKRDGFQEAAYAAPSAFGLGDQILP